VTSTIYALATAAGRAGIAIVRISGGRAGWALQEVTGRPPRAARRLERVTVTAPATGEVLDRGLAAWFPGPASFTGEDVAELHLHGGRAVAAAVLEALGRLDGLRLAEPGEFTRRAFLNDRFDLTAAEAVADLVDAETAAQRRQALRRLDGDAGRLLEAWRARVLAALARQEALLDFPDEGLPEGLDGAIADEVAAVAADIAGHLANPRGRLIREGVTVAILGPPNVGKSSLLNALARRDAAIVAAEAGTTRDVVEVHVELAGHAVVLADTAGLREAEGAVEKEGIRRALLRADQADLRVVMTNAVDWPAVEPMAASLVDAASLVVVNKVDLRGVPEGAALGGRPVLPLSLATGEGLDVLVAGLTDRVVGLVAGGDAAVVTRQRHAEGLAECRRALLDAGGAMTPELAAEELRRAMTALGRLTGRVDVEDVLDAIFREFCIGK
jgi:tRNA modification GTPase